MIFKKGKLYSKLRERDSWTYAQLLDLKDDIPNLRVKTIDAKGKVPVIQISGSDPWVKPLEWMELHRDEIKRKFQELHQRLSYMGCDPVHELNVSQGQDETSDKLQANDLRVKLERVQRALSDEVKKRVDLILNWKLRRRRLMISRICRKHCLIPLIKVFVQAISLMITLDSQSIIKDYHLR